MIFKREFVKTAHKTSKQVLKFEWFKRRHVLYIFGFFLSFRVSDASHHEFILQLEADNVTFSAGTPLLNTLHLTLIYSYTAMLFFVFLLTDFLNYIPVIILIPLSGITSTCFVIWDPSYVGLHVAAAFSGVYLATLTAYLVMVYPNAEVQNYQKLTAFAIVAPLLGQMTSSFLAQLLLSLELLNYRQLFYFDLASFVVATFLIFPLEPARDNVYHMQELGKPRRTFCQKVALLFRNFRKCFPDKYSVKLSLWIALTLCGHYQVSIRIQPLWKLLQSQEGRWLQNGTLQGFVSVVSAIAALLSARANFDWKYTGDLLVTFASLLQGFMLLLMSQISKSVLSTLFYLVYTAVHSFFMTLIISEVVRKVPKGCFAMCLGFIAFVAMGFSCAFVFVMVVHVKTTLQMEFMIYGYYQLVISVLYVFIGMAYWFAKHTYPV